MSNKERKTKQWRRTSNVIGKKSGQNVLSVKIPVTDKEGRRTSSECTTRPEIIDAASPVLTDSFSEALSLSYYRGRRFDNLGFIGASECT